jgi:hypothetical protein
LNARKNPVQLLLLSKQISPVFFTPPHFFIPIRLAHSQCIVRRLLSIALDKVYLLWNPNQILTNAGSNPSGPTNNSNLEFKEFLAGATVNDRSDVSTVKPFFAQV